MNPDATGLPKKAMCCLRQTLRHRKPLPQSSILNTWRQSSRASRNGNLATSCISVCRIVVSVCPRTNESSFSKALHKAKVLQRRSYVGLWRRCRHISFLQFHILKFAFACFFPFSMYVVGGTGLGLAISLQLSQLHDGCIWLKPNVNREFNVDPANKGCQFHFIWPLKKDPDEDPLKVGAIYPFEGKRYFNYNGVAMSAEEIYD